MHAKVIDDGARQTWRNLETIALQNHNPEKWRTVA
jgi:hypothetical protein